MPPHTPRQLIDPQCGRAWVASVVSVFSLFLHLSSFSAKNFALGWHRSDDRPLARPNRISLIHAVAPVARREAVTASARTLMADDNLTPSARVSGGRFSPGTL